MKEAERSALLASIERKEGLALGRAMTLLESTRPEDATAQTALLKGLKQLAHSREGQSLRLGFSGIPGVGKSSLIEALGLELLAQQREAALAVLSVDPSSPLSGGSILGDRTRMPRLSQDARVFIRSSPSSAVLGGTGRRSRELLLLLQAAGFDYVFVETTGIGQSEFLVASMVDLYILLQMPKTGDELQSSKKGNLDLADLVLVNKADHELEPFARITKSQLEAMLSLRAQTAPSVLLCSAKEGTGVPELLLHIQNLTQARLLSGVLNTRRQEQQQVWCKEAFEEEFRRLLQEAYLRPAGLLEQKLSKSKKPPATVGRELAQQLFSKLS